MEIMVGNVYGDLTIKSVIKRIRRFENWTRDFIEYECSCGFKKSTWKNDFLVKLKNNNLACFRCLRRKKLLSKNKEIVFKALLKSYENAAKQRNRSFSLTKSEAKTLFHGPCFYCGDPPKNTFKHKIAKFREPYYYNGIDRINNELGYVLENCVSCCKSCNLKKSDMSLNDFLAFIKKVYKHSIEGKNV